MTNNDNPEIVQLMFNHKDSDNIYESFGTTEKDVLLAIVNCMSPKYTSYSTALISELKKGNIQSSVLLSLATLSVKKIAEDIVKNT